ncbi:MAG: HNH endonuclease family protein, partial [Vicinamibacterales bacterium]
WIEREKPFKSVAEELETLSRQGDDFRRIIEPQKGDAIFGLATFLESFDIRTAYPLLLFLLNAKLGDEQWDEISTLLESYLLRRAVLGWSTKAYNRIFLNLAKSLRAVGARPEIVKAFLSSLSGESSAWPTDEQFFGAWQGRDTYHDLNNAKLVHVLSRLNDTYLTNRNERVQIDSPLTVEHILPQTWLKNWPLAGGESGLSFKELFDASADDPRAVATRRRDAALQTMGNLTILTQELNSDASNAAWAVKKSKLLTASLLPINQQLHVYDKWAEDTIAQRSKELFQKATTVWPAPLTQPAPTNG